MTTPLTPEEQSELNQLRANAEREKARLELNRLREKAKLREEKAKFRELWEELWERYGYHQKRYLAYIESQARNPKTVTLVLILVFLLSVVLVVVAKIPRSGDIVKWGSIGCEDPRYFFSEVSWTHAQCEKLPGGKIIVTDNNFWWQVVKINSRPYTADLWVSYDDIESSPPSSRSKNNARLLKRR